MYKFIHRSYQKELLDGSGIPFPDIQQNMRELNTINSLLGGHQITIKGVRKLIGNSNKKQWHIVEIGCGGGDNLRAIKESFKRKGIDIKLTGVDINYECIAYAKSIKHNQGIEFVHADYREVEFAGRPQIIFSSLFCHHFTDEELIEQVRWMSVNSSVGFFINDLHRHYLAYYSIKILTRLFSASYLVKHDAPISVLRGFKKEDWHKILSELDKSCISIDWHWAFRWLVIFKKQYAAP